MLLDEGIQEWLFFFLKIFVFLCNYIKYLSFHATLRLSLLSMREGFQAVMKNEPKRFRVKGSIVSGVPHQINSFAMW